MRRQRRTGFSAIELLVVAAILGIIFGMLMVAVARARAAAKRIESLNNLKQIGIAMHNYHDTNNVFPPGCDKNNFSTHVHLLPFIEQENLDKLIDKTKPVGDKANDKARGVIVKVFVSNQDPVLKVKDGVAPTNYVFCAGSGNSLKDNNGVFCRDSNLTLGAITNANGTSNTMAAAETLKGDGGTKAVDVRRQHVRITLDSLKPAAAPPKVDAQKLRQLIADLDSNDFPSREKATEELKKLGKGAEAALRQALGGKPSAEVKKRINDLLGRLSPDGAIAGLKEDAGVQEWKDGKNIAGDRCASWMDGRFLQTTFTANRQPDDARPDVDCEGLGGLSALRTLNGRVPVLFCDGHVQYVPNTVDLKIWKMMANWKNADAFQLP